MDETFGYFPFHGVQLKIIMPTVLQACTHFYLIFGDDGLLLFCFLNSCCTFAYVRDSA